MGHVNRLRRRFLATVVAVALVVGGGQPVLAGPGPAVGDDNGGGICPPGEGGIAWATEGYPSSPYSSSLGLELPPLDVAPIGTDALITPREGESFEPIRLVAVRARPTSKVLRDGAIDSGHALMQWLLHVEQVCPDTGQVHTCEYTYHEMPNDSVFEVATLPDGRPFEHAGSILCFGGVQGFRAPGAPGDLGVRLVAAARATVAPEQIEANAIAALGGHLVGAAGLPGLELPPDVGAWAGFIASVLGLAGLFAGGCGGYFTGVASSEIGVWLNVLTLPTAPPGARLPKAGTALAAKIASTYSVILLIPTCIEESVASGGTLAALYEMLAALGTIIYLTSTVALAYYGLQAAIAFWI